MSDFLWVEKYRPKKISDCILSEDLKSTFLKFLDSKELPNLLLSGTAGTGKTTVARALCEELGVDYIIINGSDEGRHIDTLRTTIKNFASSVSLDGNSNHKVVIIDEADYMNPDSVQPALRNLLKHFTKIVDLYLLVILRIRSYLLYIVVVLVLIFVLQMVKRLKLLLLLWVDYQMFLKKNT